MNRRPGSIRQRPSRALVRLLPLGFLLLAGCGFHLRGALPAPASAPSIFVQPPAGVLSENVQIQLRAGGITIPASAREAGATLKLENETYDRRLASVDDTSGNSREFELLYSIGVSLVGAEGETLLAPRTVVRRRDFTFDETAVIGTASEETTLREELRLEAVSEIIAQLYATLGG